MANREIAQQVIDFQFSRSRIKDQEDSHLETQWSQPTKYTDWKLEDALLELGLTDKSQYTIKWIGYEDQSYLEAFVYCLFKGCRSQIAAKNGIFIKLKYNVYEMANKFLKSSEQKSIVEHLCAAQYTKDLTQYLNKSYNLKKLFIKLLKNHCQSAKLHPSSSQLQELYQFSSQFDFINFSIMNEKTGVFQHFSEKFYIFCYKGCYFVIQTQNDKGKIIDTKKIQQSENKKQHSEALKITFSPVKKQQKTKKHFEYTTPQFILMNNKKKSSKREVRYTEMEEDQNFMNSFRQSPNSRKARAVDPISRPQISHFESGDKLPKFIQIRSTLQPKTTPYSHNPENRQKIQKFADEMRSTTKNQFMRAKTGIIQIYSKPLKNVKSASKQKSVNITFDQKQFNKLTPKKIELNLKKLTSSKTKLLNKRHLNSREDIIHEHHNKSANLLNSFQSLTPKGSSTPSVGIYVVNHF